ncbi:MAG: rbsB [Aeromicrobium sp.]|nr:rbsB [Aeromicrobium sp.]
MNPLKTVTALAMAGCLSALAACGASSSGSDGGSSAGGDKVIGVMTLLQSNPAISETLSGIKQKAKEEGYEVKVIDANFDTQKQVTAIQTLINQRVDVIMNISGDNSVMAGAFLKAEKAKIPVISLDGGATVPGIRVNYDLPEEDLGSDLANAFFDKLEAMSPGANATIIEQVLPEATPCRRREIGIEKVLKQHPEVKVVEYHISANNPTPDAFTYSSQYLASHPETVGVVSCWDDPALGAVKAAEKAGRTPDDFIVVGYNGQANALDELRKGEGKTVFAATAGFATVSTGVDAVDVATKLFAGDDVPDSLSYPTAIIDFDNVPAEGQNQLPEWAVKK